MEDFPEIEQLVAHLTQMTRLESPEARKVVDETIAFFAEPVTDFVARRHREMRRQGLRNEQIYRRLRDEVCARRFASPELTERQIRRLIYG